MNPLHRFYSTHYTPTEEEAEHLNNTQEGWCTVEVRPPRDTKIPATLNSFVKGILEIQKKWLGLGNASPRIAFEIIRTHPDRLRFQYAAPTKRLERKIRTQLTTEIPEIDFEPGTSGLPVTSEDTLGGGLLTTGRSDWHNLQTEFKKPPNNAITALLHRHAMRDTKFLVQILFQPVAGQPLRNWIWRKQAYQHRNYLKKEKETLWNSVKPSRREKQQAQLLDTKAGNTRFWASIRFTIIGAKDYTPSRVKELAGGFNQFENPVSGQYLNAVTAKTLREQRLLQFFQDVTNRRFGNWHRKFRVTNAELAALLSLPSLNQENITYATP